jgi:hypothetical protein
MPTTYLSPATDTPAIGTLSTGYSTGASSIVITTAQGTFPSPGANQAFVAVINPNTSGLLDNASTERVIVTANSSGTWTLLGTLAHNHSSGENVALVVSTTWLNNLLQLAGGTMTGPVNMGGNQVTNAAAGVASNDLATVSQTTNALMSLYLAQHT